MGGISSIALRVAVKWPSAQACACRGALIGLDPLWYAVISVESGNNSVVECDLAKVEVAGSNPVSRSIFPHQPASRGEQHPAAQVIGAVAKW